jgi:uncharacterized protein YfiM (DUF2279 family)
MHWTLFPLILFIFSTPIWAADSWKGEDKKVHAQISCGAALGTTLIWPKTHWGGQLLISQVPGILKESYDQLSSSGSKWSWKDVGANLVGAGICLPLGNWMIQTVSKESTTTLSIVIPLK